MLELQNRERGHRWAFLSQVNLSLHDAQRTHVLEFAYALSRLAQVTIINPTAAAEADVNELDYVRLSNLPLHVPILSITLAWLRCLEHLHRQSPFDVLYIRSAGNYADLAGLLWARHANLPCVLEVNGAQREEYLLQAHRRPDWQHWRAQTSIWLALQSLTWSYRWATKIVTVTKNLKEYLAIQYQVPTKKIGVFSNGVNVQQFTPLECQVCQAELGLDRSQQYIGFVGSLMAWQGVDDLLTAFAQIRQDYPNSKLLIVGDGPERQYLQALSNDLQIQEHVKFVGQIAHNQIVKFMNACDVLAVPKKPLASGYSPLKVYEYMACGRPILASAVPGLTLVADEQIGQVYAPGSIDELSIALANLLALTQTQREEMGLRARRLAVERFSWDAIVRQIVDFVVH